MDSKVSRSGNGSFRQVVTIATAVASLGASLGVNADDLVAAEGVPVKAINTSRTEVKQFKLYKDGTSFKLKGSDNMIIIIGGKTYLRLKTGAQTPAQDNIYQLQNGSRLIVSGGKVLEDDPIGTLKAH
jgi:hypothetical protein